MYKIPCNYCGKEVERENDIPLASCFTCKEKRHREVAKERSLKKRLELKKKITKVFNKLHK